jgi:hypothetical protein
MLSRLLGYFVALLLVALCSSAAAQSIPLDKAAFTQYVADRLKEMKPEGMQVQISITRPLAIRLSAPSGMSVDANLGDLHGHCSAMDGRCAEETEKLVEAAFQVFGEVTRSITPDMFRVVLRSAGWVNALNESNKANGMPPAVAKPYVGELCMVLAISGPAFTRYATAETLNTLKLDQSVAFDIALKNTKQSKAPILERALPLRGTRFQVLAEDELEPSRLLMHAEWGEVARKRPGDLIVAVPASNLLIFGNAVSADDVRALRDVAANALRTAVRSVTPQLFRWRENGWELVEDKRARAQAAVRDESVIRP